MDYPIVEVINVTKVYGDRTRVLEDVSFGIGNDEWVSIMGPSGSGKTTLLNIIGGLDKPTAGMVRIRSQDITRMRGAELVRFRRENIGYVFQQFHLIPYLSALENIMLAQYFHSMADEGEARNALDRVGLSHRLGHLPSQLSTGEQQRVCIARALVNEPKILLADEPTGNLDQANGKVVLDLFRNLHQEHHISIILITHDPDIGKMAQRRLKIIDGRME